MPADNIRLKMALNAFDFDPENVTPDELKTFASKLSFLANISPAWGWRYIHNVLVGKMPPSRKLEKAISRLIDTIDKTPEDIARSNQVMVMAIGDVKPGSLVMTNSRECANPGCKINFIPRIHNQICHSLECTRIYKRLKKLNK
jgi:hypothetical protein